MFLATHAAAGVLISQRIDSPWAIFWLAFVSHFLLDFIPHGDEDLYHEENPANARRVIFINLADLLALFVIVWLLVMNDHSPGDLRLFAGVAGGLAPDVISHAFPFFHSRYREFFVLRFLNFLKSKVLRLDSIIRLHGRIHRWFHYCISNFFEYKISPWLGMSLQAVILIVLVITSFEYTNLP